jgi:mannose-6-phosphate isomerase-like protein (cupin superfamily)
MNAAAATPVDRTSAAYVCARKEAPLVWVLGVRTRILIDSAATGGRYAMTEQYAPPFTDGPPPHSHDDFEELLHVLDGGLKVFVEGTWSIVHAGDTVMVPRGVLHTIANPFLSPSRFLTQFAPGGFEQFFLDIGAPVEPGVEPIRPPKIAPPDREKLAALVRKYRMRMPGVTK